MATRHRLRILLNSEVHNFADDVWDNHGIKENYPFVLRNKQLIVNELICGVREFQSSVLTISNSFNDPSNKKKTFDLKLASRGGNKKDNFNTIFTMKCKNNNISTQQRVTLICKCAFQKLQSPDVIKIIHSGDYKLEAEYLNYNKDGQYAVINVKSLFHITSSQDEKMKEDCFKHIRNCEWAMVENFGLYLYEMQMQNISIFLKSINRKKFRNNKEGGEEKQIEQKQNDPKTNVNGKRSWNMLESEDAHVCSPDIAEPMNKRRKVITDDDYHLKEITNEDEGIDMHTTGGNEGENTQSTQSSVDTPMEAIELPNNDMFQWGPPPSVNMDSLIEDDFQQTQLQCVHVIEEIQDNKVNDLELTPIQSVIFYKSAKHCLNELKLSEEAYKRERSKAIELINNAYNRCFEGNVPNDSQMDAITKSMVLPLSLIQGPPGTGKTSTIADLVNVLLLKNKLAENPKILLCAYTHKAANELLSKILSTLTRTQTITKEDTHILLRLGEEDKCPKILRPFCYTEKFKHYSTSKEEEKKAAIEDIFGKARVVIGTAYSCGSNLVKNYIDSHQNKVFGTVVIDECTQILDPVINIIVNALDHSSDSHLVLVGDHKQLPPIIRSDAIKHSGYKTIFETLVLENDALQCDYFTMLDIQYRMAKPLIGFCNKEFYDGKIKSHTKSLDMNNVKLQSIMSMISAAENHANVSGHIEIAQKEGVPMYVIKLKNGKKEEKVGSSWKNEEEARYICQYLLGEGNSLEREVSVGIISFYKLQASLIGSFIKNGGIDQNIEDIMSSTVDAFQGKEKDLIILSMVNDVIRHPTKFNLDFNRINVALSRCKKALIVVTSYDFDLFDKLDVDSYFSDNNKGIWRRWFRDFQIYGIENKSSEQKEMRAWLKRIVNDSEQTDDKSQKKEVCEWLKKIGMSQYCKKLIENGFDTMENMETIKMPDLVAIGIGKLGHRRRIFTEANKLMGVYL